MQAAKAAFVVQLAGSCDAEAASADAVPGAETRQLSRLHAILGRHLTMAAAEEAALAGHLVDLEAQAVEVQAQIASAHRQLAHQAAANLELERALRAKIEGLNTATRPVLQAVTAITEREVFAAVETKLGERMSPTWCAQNGMGGLTVQAASAIFQHLIEAARELDQAQLMALLHPGQPQTALGTQPPPAPGQPATLPPKGLLPPATQLQPQVQPLTPPLGSVQHLLVTTGTTTAASTPPPPHAGLTPPAPIAGVSASRGRSRSNGRTVWADTDPNAQATPLQAPAWVGNS